MFFDARQQALAVRTAELQARSAALRHDLGQHSHGLRATLRLADQCRAGWRWLKAHPQWVGVGVAVLMVWRPRRAWRLGRRLWGAWRLWGRLRLWQSTLGPLLPRR